MPNEAYSHTNQPEPWKHGIAEQPPISETQLPNLATGVMLLSSDSHETEVYVGAQKFGPSVVHSA
jgi:hypothetical protein